MQKIYNKNKKGYIIRIPLVLFLSLLVLFPAMGGLWAKSNGKVDIEALIKKKDFDSLENYCFGLNGRKQMKCYKRLGDAYLEAKDYHSAALSYQKCGYVGGIGIAADKLMANYDYRGALDYYLKILNTYHEESPHLYARIGKAYLELGDVERAVEFFEKGVSSGEAAIAYGKYAETLNKNNDHDNAKKYYQKAIQNYEFVLKNFSHQWKDSYFPHLRECLQQRAQFEKTDREKADEALLKKILPGVAAYCDRMQNSVFRFFCKEVVREMVDYTTDVRKIKMIWSNLGNNRLIFPSVNKYVYEYQLLKKNDKVLETRRLVKQNGVKKNEANAKLKTQVHQYEKLIFGPIALLSSFWQKRFYYNVLGEEKLWKRDAVVLEALPLHRYKKNHLFGKIWIDKTDFTVLKIQWYPKSISYSSTIEWKARLLGAKPEVTFYAEFKSKKRGVRFPTRFFLEEAYLNAKGKKYPRLRQEITMKDYLFFIVASEVIDEQPELLK